MSNPTNEQELREQLAAIEHERWADWQKYCHKVLRDNNPSPEQGDILERWDRQINTPYAELSEKEKDSDREQVDRYWHLVKAFTNAEIARVLDRLEQDDAKLTDGRRLELDIPSWVEAERAKLKEVK